MSLQIRKLSTKSWKHVDSIDGAFILTKFYAKTENDKFLIIEVYGSKRREYLVTDIEVYDIGGTAETFANLEDLILRLEELKYTGFYQDGDVISNGVLSVDGSIVDNTDSLNPIINTPSLQQVIDIDGTTTNRINIEDEVLTVYNTLIDNQTTIDADTISNSDTTYSTDINFRTRTQNTDFYFEDEGGSKSIATREWVTANAGGSNVITEINTTGTASVSTTETITYSVLIPANTMSVGVYDAIARVNKTGTAGIVTINMYINDTNNLTTPILIGRSISTATARYMPLQKFIDIKVLNGTGLGTEVANNANSATFPNDYIQHGNTAGMSNVAIDWTIDQYLIVTVTNAIASDSSTGTFLILKK